MDGEGLESLIKSPEAADTRLASVQGRVGRHTPWVAVDARGEEDSHSTPVFWVLTVPWVLRMQWPGSRRGRLYKGFECSLQSPWEGTGSNIQAANVPNLNTIQAAQKEKRNRRAETCLVAQWLTLCTSTEGGMGSIPGQGTKISHAAWCGKRENKQTKKQTSISWSLTVPLSGLHC